MRFFPMIKRAFISGMIALIAAVIGFGGILEGSAKIAQTTCFVFLALCTVSLLLSLFEEEPNPSPVTTEDQDIRAAHAQSS